jgi:hypothetical protein
MDLGSIEAERLVLSTFNLLRNKMKRSTASLTIALLLLASSATTPTVATDAINVFRVGPETTQIAQPDTSFCEHVEPYTEYLGAADTVRLAEMVGFRAEEEVEATPRVQQ